MMMETQIRVHLIINFSEAYLSARFNGSLILWIGITASGALGTLSPLAVKLGPGGLIAIRSLQGLFEGLVYPAAQEIWSKWAPKPERTRLITFGYCGANLGSAVYLILSGVIAGTIGWRYIFYVSGALTCMWSIFWPIVTVPTPKSHSTITESELQFLEIHTDANQPRVTYDQVPWRSVVRSVPFWALTYAHFCSDWSWYTWFNLLPTYLHDVTKISVSMSGILSAVAHVIMFVLLITGGFVSDWLQTRDFTTGFVRRLTICGGLLLQMVFLLASLYDSSLMYLIICVIVAAGVGRLAFSGVFVNQVDLAPRFAAMLMGVSNTIGTIPGIVGIVMEGVVVYERSSGQWKYLLIFTGILNLTGAIVYGMLGSGRKQIWADHVEAEESSPEQTPLE